MIIQVITDGDKVIDDVLSCVDVSVHVVTGGECERQNGKRFDKRDQTSLPINYKWRQRVRLSDDESVRIVTAGE